MDDVYSDNNGYNPNRNSNIFIVFDDMIGDVIINKKFQAIMKKYLLDAAK